MGGEGRGGGRRKGEGEGEEEERRKERVQWSIEVHGSSSSSSSSRYSKEIIRLCFLHFKDNLVFAQLTSNGRTTTLQFCQN